MPTALLSLIPARWWLYLALALGLFLFWRHYETLEHEVQANKAVAAQAQAIVKTDNQQAQSTETQSVLIYKQAVQVPAVGDIGVECVRKQPSGGALPPAGAVPGTPTGEQLADSGTGSPYDPSGAALTRARQADEQIKYLQRRVHELEDQMNKAP